ncbi:MAG: hypothetical protein QOJ16_2774 [Acidobacteriota bacterium]|jgi:hypothetical protein|nr:hypothetical protein [Acidobacteriota bacterium]
MKALHRSVLFLLLLLLAATVSTARAATLTLTGTVQFSSLDGSADDSDPTPGVFAYNGTLVIDGSINCNDDPPLADADSACPISIRTTGDLVLDAGSTIYAENRRDQGNGGNITLDVGGNLALHSPDGSLPGAVISSGRTSTLGPHGAQHAGNIQITVGGTTTLAAGSTIAASSPAALAGSIQITGQGKVTIAGLISSGPSATLLSTRFSGNVVAGGVITQVGGPITIISRSTTGPGIEVTADGTLASQGEAPGAGRIQLEACGIAVRGLVVSLGRMNGAAQVVLRSGKDILVDGQDLDNPSPAGGRLGRVRAESARGGAGYRAALYARGDIQVVGPAPAQSTLSAVSADSGPTFPGTGGGTVAVVSLAGAITGSGNAFEAGILNTSNQGGTIDLGAQGNVTLDGGNLRAVGDYTSGRSPRHGGTIRVRSYAQEVSWTNGLGDVRPTGAGVPAAVRGTLTITYCTSDALTGTQFPTNGAPIQPWPVETQSCADAAPTLPTGEPDLPQCGGPAPIAADDAYSTPQGQTLTVPAPGVLANDQGTGLAVTPQSAAPTAQGGTVTLNADGSFTYTPPTGFSSPPDDSFTYTVTNTGGSATATVRITVNPNAKPTVQSTSPTNGATNVAPGTTVTITWNESVNVTGTAFRLECPSGTPVAFTVTPASPATTFVLYPTSPLPGGTTCTVTVAAAQVTDVDASQHPAADYVFSFSTAIAAADDLYPETVIGNVGVDSNAIAYSVTANDSAGNGATITAYDTTTAHGGKVVMTTSGAGIGRFTYVPPAGYQGADSFHYTITNGGSSATATVNLNVLGILWFIDNHAVAGDGRLSSPFNSLAAFQAVNNGTGTNPGPNHNIFLFESDTDYTGPLTLLSGQKLIGQDATASLVAITGLNPGPSSFALPATNSGNPVIVRITSSGNGINLGQNNTLRGLTVGNTTGTAITGSGFGTLTVADVTVNTTGAALDLASGTANATFNAVSSSGGTHNINLSNLAGTLIANGGALSGSTGTAFNVDQGTANVTYAGSITSGVRTVSITNRTGGTVTLSGAISETGTGIFLSANTGSTITFSGAVTATTGANLAFTATGGGTVNATGGGSTLTTTTATALNVVNTTIGASGLTFQSVSANGGANGIVLDTTGASGGLTVTGTGTAGSGGTIRNLAGADGAIAGIGVFLNKTSNISLNWMQLGDFQNFAIRGTSVSGFTLSHSVINGANGTNSAAPFNEGSVSFSELTGAATISSTSIGGGFSDNVRVVNTKGSLDRITFSSVTIGANSTTDGNDGVTLEAQGTATLNVTVQNSNFTSARGDLFQLNLLGTSKSDLVFTGNTLSNNHPAIATGGGGVTISGGDNTGSGVTLTYNVANNTVRDANGHAFLIVKSTDPGSFTGTFTNNTIGVTSVANSGSQAGSGLKVQNAGLGTVQATITDNHISQYNNFGIELVTGGSATPESGNLIVTVTGNTISNPGTGGLPMNGIQLNGGTVPGDTYQVCAMIGGAGLANSITGSGANGGTDFRLRQRQSTTVRLPGYGGANSDNAAVVAFVQGNNGGASGLASNTVSTGGGGFVGGSACQ